MDLQECSLTVDFTVCELGAQCYLNGTLESAIPCAMIDPEGGGEKMEHIT